MQIGSLAEWVTGIAELLAVAGALFLPMIRTRIETKKSMRKNIKMAHAITDNIIHEKKTDPTVPVSQLHAYKDFRLFINLVEWRTDDENAIVFMETLKRIIFKLDDPNTDFTEVQQEVKELAENYLKD